MAQLNLNRERLLPILAEKETPHASNMACFILSGPGVKVGYERDWQRWGMMRMVDLCPTIARFMGLRTPRHNMGAVLEDLLE